ncbi:MAG: SpoIID/LytB domain-containing protein, partial [Actinobacteria bacterium]
MPFRFKLIFVALLTALIITVLGFPLAPFIQSEAYFTFTGGGHGHGVGMSMAGVKKQAKAGRDYPTIMKYYYGSIRVGKKSLPRYIRAAILSTTSKLSFSANKDFRVYDSRNRYLKTVKRSDAFKVSFKRGRYYLYVVRKSKTIWSARRNISIVIKPWRASYLRLNNNGRRFKGNFYARSIGGSSIWAINKVSLRTYLKGLGEEPESWPIKGLRTLAVAARTYAVGKINKKQKHYDILPQQQYYVGIRKAPRLASAVNSTKSVIATYGTRPILAAYSANSGGYVADFRTIWGGKGYPYLRARKDNWSKGTKNYRWGPVTFSRSRLQSILRKQGVNVGTISAIRLGSRASDRRPVRVKVIGSKGNRTLRAYSEFSAKLGLKSSLIWVRKGGSKRLTINASTKRLRPGQPLLIYGRITPKTKGTLTLRYKKGGRGWKTAKRVKVNGSRYKIKVRPNTANRYVFSAKLGSRRSRNMVILARGKRVKRLSGKGKASLSAKRISINASAKRVRPRQPILIYGKATFLDKTTL